MENSEYTIGKMNLKNRLSKEYYHCKLLSYWKFM